MRISQPDSIRQFAGYCPYSRDIAHLTSKLAHLRHYYRAGSQILLELEDRLLESLALAALDGRPLSIITRMWLGALAYSIRKQCETYKLN